MYDVPIFTMMAWKIREYLREKVTDDMLPMVTVRQGYCTGTVRATIMIGVGGR
eukprot:CAMPEP_0201622840 /NCGR_PEP_ID=MMETSP0492-20130828/47609_1 /ASSEMBLY_ACC=CAM_ASM_000837 /TAXON_ID=420259 /ORGANISM="Thalassiosira gravida, Strain GMp14c1" /LENGTH=52 /DNA_ID=CAMNT_0048092433 /DNA_START=1021 /DNA_END=1179 /DNA_ORIENTATION=+